MRGGVTSYAVIGAGSLIHTEHTGRSLITLSAGNGLLSLEVLDWTGCAALVTANLAGCESLQTVRLNGCAGLRKFHLPR
jgi:hypothetical protein